MKPKLEVKNLHVSVEDKEILKGVDLTLRGGEFHVIMGPNGTGKSTLAQAIMGAPKYTITDGVVFFNDENVLEMSVDERARKGLFLAMQYPQEVPGVTNSDFVRTAMQARTGSSIPLYKFIMDYDKAIKKLKMNDDIPHRYLNDGFSGGEKKRNEILQMLMLKPTFAILDEIDSGLDVDALKVVGEAVNSLKSDEFGCLLITHYQRILDYIKPDVVHVMMQGRIVKTGGIDLIEKIDNDGYDWIKAELGIDNEKVIPEERHKRPALIGECGVKKSLK